MRLQAPYSRHFIEAEGEHADFLIKRGYIKADEQSKKPATRKRTFTKEK